MIAALGVGAYRFSISWPRIQPTGSGAVAAQGIDFYNRLVDGLLERGIEPFATLYHWDLPAALQRERNGWANRTTAYRFADYATLVAEQLGDRVRSFATHNEPWVTATIGHELGHFAPGLKDRAVAMQVSHHCLLSHGLAMLAMRGSRSNIDIGIVLNLSPVYAASDSPADTKLASRKGRPAGALVHGRPVARGISGRHSGIPGLGRSGASSGRRAADFSTARLPGGELLQPHRIHRRTFVFAGPRGHRCHRLGWEVAPASFTELLTRLDRDYELPPLFITENGAAYRDLVIDGHVRDEERRAYIESHIRAIADAIDQGVDVRGYFVWSLLDNFEWAAGYTKRFGIYYVDYQTQARILKRSGFWYKDLAAAFNRTRAGTRIPQGQV